MNETFQRMKNYILSLLAGCFFVTFSFAQQDEIRVGLKGGLNLANISGDNVDGSFLLAHHIGAFVEIPINEKLAFVPEFMFSAQGFKDTETQSFSGLGLEVSASLEQNVRLNYFNFPLLLRFNITDALHFEAGPQIGLLSTAKSKSEGSVSGTFNGEDIGDLFDDFDLELTQEGSINVRDQFTNIDAGFTAGVGAHFTNNVGMSVRYYLGLTDISNTPMTGNLRNNVIMASFFYRF